MPKRMMIAAGEVDIGRAVIGGIAYVRVKVTDPTDGSIVDLTFEEKHFVTVADHLRMVADEIVKAQPSPRPPFR